jgi:hypothetical protein
LESSWRGSRLEIGNHYSLTRALTLALKRLFSPFGLMSEV